MINLEYFQCYPGDCCWEFLQDSVTQCLWKSFISTIKIGIHCHVRWGFLLIIGMSIGFVKYWKPVHSMQVPIDTPFLPIVDLMYIRLYLKEFFI